MNTAEHFSCRSQDSGLILPQHRSGKGLTPASLHIQVNDTFCIFFSKNVNYASLEILEGSVNRQ